MSTFDDSARCPACGGLGLAVFHEERGVPSHSCLLLDDPVAARDFPVGDIRLGLCERCGFIANAAFDPSLSAYSARYEETQGFSQRFQTFASQLAKRWVEEYGLHGKTVLEIGCGKGEFLVHMVENGAGRGIGIDPGVNPARIESEAADRLTWLAELFSEQHVGIETDAIVCRHTLEHIPEVAEFLGLIRRMIGDRTDIPVLFELPDVMRVLRETAFWDVYYEHCSYFSIGSLSRLFRRCGFDVLAARLEYDDQYIVLEARATDLDGPASIAEIEGEDDLAEITRAAADFESEYSATIERWRGKLRAAVADGRRAVIWGGGSKGVAFLGAVGGPSPSGSGAGALIEHVVDINPFKAGKYMAGGGQRVVPPEFLQEHKPDIVVVMNSIYRSEISETLRGMGIEAELWTL